MDSNAAGASPARLIFVEALLSETVDATIPAADRIFDPFIGSWDLVVRWFDAAGRVTREAPGEWHFARVLDGRGVQDVWIVPPRGSRGTESDYEYGTSVRFYDPDIGAWQSTWIGPMHRVVRTFTARRIDARVLLETVPGTEPRLRWSFLDIAESAFAWTNEVHENGVWRTQQTFEARRRERDRSSLSPSPAP